MPIWCSVTNSSVASSASSLNLDLGAPQRGHFSGASLKAILEAAGLTMDNVVKTTVFLADMSLFAPMNEVYAKAFSAPLLLKCWGYCVDWIDLLFIWLQ